MSALRLPCRDKFHSALQRGFKSFRHKVKVCLRARQLNNTTEAETQRKILHWRLDSETFASCRVDELVVCSSSSGKLVGPTLFNKLGIGKTLQSCIVVVLFALCSIWY